MKKNGLKFPLSKVKEAVKPWLFLEADQIIDVMCAVIIANQFKTDPLWMIFLGPPSHAKTELLRSLDGHPGAYFLSNLTPATLVSGACMLPSVLEIDPGARCGAGSGG